jgi:hypothetical protein
MLRRAFRPLQDVNATIVKETANMKRKNLIALAVAGACAWPVFATAEGTHSMSSSMGHWEVATPSSVDESAPSLAAERSHLGMGHAGAAHMASATFEVITPSSSDESAPWLTAEEQRSHHAPAIVAGVGMPNPQTPWSPNESGPADYAGDMQAYSEHLASVEQAHFAALESRTETLASGATESEIDRLLLGSSELPSEPGEREQVASLTPGLVDSRQLEMSSELSAVPASDAPDAASGEPASFTGQQELDSAGAGAESEAGSGAPL